MQSFGDLDETLQHLLFPVGVLFAVTHLSAEYLVEMNILVCLKVSKLTPNKQ